MKYSKAICGALVAGLTVLATGLPDGLSGAEWLAAAIATLTVAGGVYAAPKNADEGNDEGAVSIVAVCLVVIAAVLLLSWLGVHRNVG